MPDKRFMQAIFGLSVVALGILTALGLFYWQGYVGKQCFLPGVVIAAVDVKGYDIDRTVTVLQDNLTKAYLTPVVFTSGDYEYRTTLGHLTYPVDVPGVVNGVFREEKERGLMSKVSGFVNQNPTEYKIPIEYRADIVQGMLQEWQNALGVPAVNARLEIDQVKGLVVIPEKAGKEIDYNTTWAKMITDWSQACELEVAIVMQDTTPAVTAQDLDGMGELSSYTTWYKVSEVDRTHNLAKAAHIINGVVVNPGQVFSFNGTVGPRTGITGYKDALIIVGDKFEPGTGGGICQVSSTLYNACLLAGLEIVERYNHGILISYMPPGLDATVTYGLQDYCFRNNTKSPVYVRAVAGGGKLTVSIYGNLADKKRIELSYVIDQVIPFAEVEEIRADMDPGEIKVDHEGIPGYVVRSFRTYLDAGGQIISSEQLGWDHYRPLNKLTLVGEGTPTDLIDPVPDPTDPFGTVGDPLDTIERDLVDPEDPIDITEEPTDVPASPDPPDPFDGEVETEVWTENPDDEEGHTLL